MLVLISPAKSMRQNPFLTLINSNYRTEKQVLELSGVLEKMSTPQLMELMKISEKLATLNQDRYTEIVNRKTTQKPAVSLFDGDVYKGLKAENWAEKQQKYAQGSLRILSGMYGLLRPFDEISAYRLEMGTKLTIGEYKNLYQYWGNQITDFINADLKENNHEWVANLASNEYFKSVKVNNLDKPVLTINFKEEKNGQFKVVAFHAKKARGLMADYIIQNEIKSPEEVKSFTESNYIFNKDLSSETELIFTR